MQNVQGIKVCTFTRKVSNNGNVYFVGKSGPLQYTMINDLVPGRPGQEPVWTLYLSEAYYPMHLPRPPVAQGAQKRTLVLPPLPRDAASRAEWEVRSLDKKLGLPEIMDVEMFDA